MGLFDHFPYTNFHELNLDWILKALKELEHTIDQFVAINALKYADPIQWDITSQYEKNTIVIDPQTGTAYISVQPVPIGVSLTNPDYWTVVFDLGSFVVRAAKNLANTYEAETTLTATVNTPAGGWLVWGDTLYKANVNITAGDSYIEGGNISHFTIEDVAGHLEDLNTTDKSNLVAAINNVLITLATIAGDLADLNTTDKSNLVAAINEVLTRLVTTAGDLADLDTTDKSNLVAAINEVLTRLVTTAGDLADLSTTDKSSLVAAINEVNSTGGGAIALIGDLNDLNTTDKSNLVGAINEVLQDTEDILTSQSWIKPESFGAVGDGITDDTAAFIACFASAAANNNAILLTSTYLLAGQVELFDGAYLLGSDGATIKCTYVSSDTTVRNAGNLSCSNHKDITIKNIKFIGTGASTSSYDKALMVGGSNADNVLIYNCSFEDARQVAAISFYSSNNITVDHCTVKNYTHEGISFGNNTSHSTVKYCKVLNGRLIGPGGTQTDRYAIVLSGWDYEATAARDMPTDNAALYNYVEDDLGHWEGIDAHGGIGFKIIGNTVRNCAVPIAVFSQDARYFYCQDCIISNNMCITDNDKISSATNYYNLGTFSGRHMTVTGNYFRFNTYVPFTVSTLTKYWGVGLGGDVRFQNNSIINAPVAGIVLSNYSGRVFIDDNTCYILDQASFTPKPVFIGVTQNLGEVIYGDIRRNNTHLNPYKEFGIINTSTFTFADNNYFQGVTSLVWDGTRYYPDYASAPPASLQYNGHIIHNTNIAANNVMGWVGTGSAWVPMAKFT